MKMKRLAVQTLIASMLIPVAQARADGHEVQLLKAQVQQLMQRIEQLEKEQAQTAQVVAEQQTAAPLVKSGNNKLRVTVSGQINRAVLLTDDGVQTDTFHVDNDASSTRVRVVGEGDVAPGQVLGTAVEVEVESNSTAVVSQDDKSGGGSDNFRARRLEMYYEHDGIGKFWLGKGWTASEDTSEYDLSGTAMAGYSSTADMAAGLRFRDGAGNLTDTTVGDVFVNLDGLGFRNRIRYDSPTFSGFKLATSAAEGDAWDVALTYQGEYSYAEVVAAIAYSEPGDLGSHESRINGSWSVLFKNGWNFTMAHGEDRDDNGGNGLYYYYKGGYQAMLNRFGTTAFSIDYHHTDEIGSNQDEGTSWGLQVVQHFDEWNSEAYLGFRTYGLERLGSDFEDVDALIMGGRIRF